MPHVLSALLFAPSFYFGKVLNLVHFAMGRHFGEQDKRLQVVSGPVLVIGKSWFSTWRGLPVLLVNHIDSN